eukprot:gnl/MRDRNA2_/MRDRNA2_107404_c0_seq1.p1 gnl/MRDRNA2_/MRDRNA2_107404_c0~~gnl/MRDRNA2_/MRDRNA2_107404_c0_seq1.p1  ORF type:complete len:378 (-),score=58.49 gnl/MRDRNA2_/MRDRNA2_107404_c0_seq1:55-1188(-)
MVNCVVVRIINYTKRTFILQLRGFQYSPMVCGEALPGGLVTIPPGFDEKAENLFVPWAATSRGLQIVELKAATDSDGPVELPVDAGIRCVTGPSLDSELKTDVDFLRVHDGRTQEPLRERDWLSLGKRNFWGIGGQEVEVALIFNDTAMGKEDASSEDEAGMLADIVKFVPATFCARTNTVLLNVYDLAEQIGTANMLLNNSFIKRGGLYHAGVEIYGDEWGFYCTEPQFCGIYPSTRPKYHPVHIYRQSVILGDTKLSEREVHKVLASMRGSWMGGDYDVLHRNCIHFCVDFCEALGVDAPPSWITAAHSAGAALVDNMPWLFGGYDAQAVHDNLPDECPADDTKGSTTASTSPDGAECNVSDSTADNSTNDAKTI